MVWDLALVMGLLGLCIAVGRAALERTTRESPFALESALFSLATGIGIVGTSILGLGVTGFLTSAGLSLLGLALIVIGRKQFTRLPALIYRAWSELTSDWGPVPHLVLGIISLFLLSQAALPPSDFDSLVYHLALPELYLREGRVLFTPDNLHAAYIGIVHMLYIPLLAAGSASAPAVLSSVLALALVPVVYLLARRVFDEATGQLATVLVWGGPVLLLVAITPRVDVTLVLFLLLAHYVLLLVLREPGRAEVLWLSGLFLGIGIGVKLNALLYTIALAPLILLIIWAQREHRRPVLVALVGTALALAAASIPWLLKNWAWFGSPLYPAFAEPIAQGWLQTLYHGDVPDIQLPLPPLQQVRAPFNLLDFFLAPNRLTPGESSFYFANPVLLLLLLWLVRRRGAAKLWLALPAFAYGALVLLRNEFTNLRYLIPVVVPLSIVGTALLATTLRRRLRWIAAIVLLVPMLATMVIRVNAWPVRLYLSGHVSSAEYRNAVASGELFTYINDHTPVDSRVLMLFEARAFSVDRYVIPDPAIDNWVRVAPVANERCLESTDITHVVVNRRILDYHLTRGLDPASVRWGEFPAFAERCLVLDQDGGWYQLYRVRPEQPANDTRDGSG